jgi:hypothetical protein
MPLRVRDRASSFLVSELQTEEKKTKKKIIFALIRAGGLTGHFCIGIFHLHVLVRRNMLKSKEKKKKGRGRQSYKKT